MLLNSLEVEIMLCFKQSGKPLLETLKILDGLPGKPTLSELEQAIKSLDSLGLIRIQPYGRASTPKIFAFHLTEKGIAHIKDLPEPVPGP